MSAAVHSDEVDYVAAIAELPLSAHRASSRAGAIVVVPRGARWAERAREAIEAGAAALVLRDPRGEPEELARHLSELPTRIPIVIERPLLRSDLVEDARRGGTAAPALLQVECSASSADLGTVAADAVGWARVLAGGPLEYRASGATPRGFTVLLDHRTEGGSTPDVPITLLATRRPGGSPWIRAIAIGPERIEVTVDVARRSATVELATQDGRATRPRRWEAPERVALRRAIEALEAGSSPSDVEELGQDSALIARVERSEAAG